MATEEKKKEHLLRLAVLVVEGLAVGIWDMVGESAFAFSVPLGNHILEMMEKEMGLEIAGGTPEEALVELGRIFVDEFGFSTDVAVETKGNVIALKVKDSADYHLVERLSKIGDERPFVCSVMNAGDALLRRMGVKARSNVALWKEGRGLIVTFELI